MIEPEADIFSDWQTIDQYTKTFKDYVDADGMHKCYKVIHSYISAFLDFDDATSTQITFNIKQDDYFFLMPDLELDMTLSLCDKQGDPLPNELPVAPVNWLTTSLFSDLKMKLGNEYIEGGDANYWLKAYFLLTYFTSVASKNGLQQEMGIYSKGLLFFISQFIVSF